MSVIQAYFDDNFFDQIFTSIQHHGLFTTENSLVAHGYHPSFVKAAIRKIIRTRGW